MVKRWSLISLFALLLLTVLIFSMSLVSVGAQDAPPPPTPAVSEMGSGGINISFWNGLSGSDGVTLNSMIAQFVAENPDISVTTEIVDWNTLYPKLEASFVAGNPPDVFLTGQHTIPYYQSIGVLMDLSSWYDTSGGALAASDFSQPGFDSVFVEGVPYGVPLDNHGKGTWVNNALLETAGLDPNSPPADYEEFLAMLQQVTLDANGNNAASPDFDPEQIVQYGTAFAWPFHDFDGILAQHGGTLLSEDGKTATINSPEGVAALQKMVDLIYTYHVAPPTAGFDSWQSFAGGRVAIFGEGTWFRNFIVDQTDIEWSVWPQYPLGDTPATWFGVHTFMIPATAEGEKLAAARRMVEWIAEHQELWAASGMVPARASVRDALDPATYVSNITIGQSLPEMGVPSVRSTAYLELQTAYEPEIVAALNGQKTPQEALDDAAARMQQILDRTQQ